MHTNFPAKKQGQHSEKPTGIEPETGGTHTYTVRDANPKTAQRHGISTPERKRLVEAAHHMRRHFPEACMFFVVESHGDDRRAVSALSRQVKSHVVLEQRRAGFPPWWVEVVESKPYPHTNLVAPLPPDAAERIALAPAYEGHVCARPVSDMTGLVRYLLKEATPQAAYKTGVRRLAGSHVLDGGGDRVRLSRALGAALLEEGLIDPWTRSYAARATTAAEAVQDAPEATAAVPTPPPTVEGNGQFAFTFPGVVDLRERLEAARRDRGLSQQQVAAAMGIRQPHYSNGVVRRHDRLSATVVRRALAWLRAA